MTGMRCCRISQTCLSAAATVPDTMKVSSENWRILSNSPVDHADPSLYDRNIDFHDTELALILDDKKIDNHLKAEMLVGIKR